MEHKLPELPYAMNALAPYVSDETLKYHYSKRHARPVCAGHDAGAGVHEDPLSWAQASGPHRVGWL